MKGLFLSIDQNHIVIQAHPLLRMYLGVDQPLGMKLDDMIESMKDLRPLLDNLNDYQSSGSTFKINLKKLDLEFHHYTFDRTMNLRLMRSEGEECIYSYVADSIDELEESYRLFLQKEELFSKSISVLKDMSINLLNETSSKIAARKSIELVCELFGAENAMIRMLKNKRTLVKYVAYGIQGEYLSNYVEVEPRDIPLYNLVLNERKLIVDDNPKIGLGYLYPEIYKFTPFDAIVAMPMINNNEVVGILTMLFKDTNLKLIKESEDILGNIGNELNFMLEKGDYFLELLDTTERLRSLNMSIVTALSDAVETRDPYTRGHSERVAAYAVEIARNMGWDDYELDRLRTAGVLHDIGKVGIPDAVLLKPGALSKYEYEIIKLHPDMSAAIVSEIESFNELIPWVKFHHENYDGSGYPARLSGNEIPVGARIIAVADAFDAMTSNRPYRKGLPIDRVREIFLEGRNRQWDPDIVDVAMDNLEVILESSAISLPNSDLLNGFRQRVFNMNLMDGLYLFQYVYDEAIKLIDQQKSFCLAVISLKKKIDSFSTADQKQAISNLIDIIKKHVHYPLLVSRYNYHDLIIMGPNFPQKDLRKIVNQVLVEFFQQTNLFFSSNILRFPDDAVSIDKLLLDLLDEKKDASFYN